MDTQQRQSTIEDGTHISPDALPSAGRHRGKWRFTWLVLTSAVAVNLLGLVVGIIWSSMPAVQASHATMDPVRTQMVVVAGVRKGPDAKYHDAYTPTDITAHLGQKVIITIYNYDEGQHSITAPDLGLNAVMRAATHAGVPAVTTVTFTATKAGVFHWHCQVPCDDTAHGWAMSHMQYMAGTITIQKA